MGRLDKLEDFENFLLIVLDTPDKKRIDYKDYDKASKIINSSIYPFIENLMTLNILMIKLVVLVKY